MSIKILLVDDHEIVREGIRAVFASLEDMTVVGEASDGREAIKKADYLRPDVIIMDITMPGMNGIEATRIICKRQPSARIIILSMHNTSEQVFRAVQVGARAYLLKTFSGEWLVNAVNAVIKGEYFYGSKIIAPPKIQASGKPSSTKSPLESLSQREREVVQLAVEGKTSLEIAEILLLSPKSIETYRSRLMQKLGVRNLPSLVKFALLHGITTID